jgi:hypothetical protein
MVIAVMGKFGKPHFVGRWKTGKLMINPDMVTIFLEVNLSTYGQLQPLWWEKSEKESEEKE